MDDERLDIQETPDVGSDAESGDVPEYVQVVELEDAQGIIAAASRDAAAESVRALTEYLDVKFAGLNEGARAVTVDFPDAMKAGTVSLKSDQYQELRGVLAAEVGTQVVCVGLTALLLGAVVGVAVTLHWRTGRS